ncbi:retrovirus-related pol polyprotein from transposon TNT 1-94 [Tanacetum coccineum]
MLLYIKGKENGNFLVDSVLNGPFQLGTIEIPGNANTPATIRDRTHVDLTEEEKLRASVDIKAMNIVLQGLPQDIYNLVNHNDQAKQIWDRVKLLIQGSELSKQERESRLYDDFDMFTSQHGETIHLYYMRQHEAHANEVRLNRKCYSDAVVLVANSLSCLNPTQYYPQITSANQQYYSPPALQRVTVQTVQGRQTQRYANNGARSNTITRGTTRIAVGGQGSMVKCYNCQEEGHYARQCTKPKRPKNSAWFKEKLMLTEALESGAYLDPEQLVFLADNGDTFIPAQASQEIPTLAAFQIDDLDAFDSDCDDAPSAKAVLMANLSSYDSHVLSEVQNHDTNIESDMSYQSMQEAQRSKQLFFNNDTDIDITSDNNIISYEQYLQETETLVVQSTSSTAQQDELLMSVIDEMQSQVAKCNKVQQENKIFNETVIIDRNAKVADFEKQILSLKLQLNATVESHKTLSTTVEILKEASKQKEDKYLDEIIDLQKDKKALDNVVYKMGQSTQAMHMLIKPQVFYDECHKTALGYQNPFYLTQARRKVHALYDGHTIVKKHDTLTVNDTEETFELAKKSRLKMLAKQNNETAKEKKVNFAPVNYAALYKLAKHFVKHFVPQKQLSTEQAFWLPISQPVSAKQKVQPEPVFEKEIPRELPSISLHKEMNEMKEVFQQMETEVTKCQVDRKCFEIEKKELILESKCLLEHIICQDVMNVVMHANLNNVLPMPANFLEHDNSALETLYIDEYNENLELKAELAKKMTWLNRLLIMNFQNDVPELKIGINEWQAKLDVKDHSIAKLREHIASLKGKNKDEMEHARELRPFDSDLDSACKYTTRIQELLLTRKVRFTESASTSKDKSQMTANKLGYRWIPTGRTFTINGNKYPLTRITPNSKVTLKKPVTTTVVKPVTHTTSASGSPNKITNVGSSRKSKNVVQIVLWYLDSGCTKNITGHRSQLINFVSKFLGTVRFGNDQIAKIMGYGNYQLGKFTILRVYYVEGLGHNLFLVGQFCDSDLEVAFQKHTCFVWNLDGADLITRSRDMNLYSISLDDMLKTSLICLLSKASKTKSWLWHHRLSHLNFGTLNQLAKDGLARGIPKLIYQKDHLCFVCALGNSKKSSHTLKAEDTNQVKLNLLHMDLCGPMRMESINEKKYILSFQTLGGILSKWTKNHPLSNVIGNPSRSVSTRKQLQENTLWCYFDAFLSSVEPKNFKEAMKDSCWIEAMQEELHEFERLEVWELVPRPDRVMIITLKWLYKLKLA